MDRSADVIARARTQMDVSCYVWSCTGQDLNKQKNVESFVRAKETTGDRETCVQRVMRRYAKLKAAGQESILCFDCSGFIYWLFRAFDGLISGRRNAAGLYGLCKEKKTRGTLQPGDLVFVWNGTRISHVGLYVGSDRVIHCKGRDVGVIEEAINKHGWNRYGRWPGMYDDEPGPTPEPPEPGTYVFTRALKYGMKGDDVVELKKLLIARGYSDGITTDTASSASYGAKTRELVRRYQKAAGLAADGIAGRNTVTALGGYYAP